MEVINIGSLNIDKVYGVVDFVKAGETIAAYSALTFCGGKGLNQSVALARAGLTVRHAGMIGSDGGILLEELAANGVDTELIKEIDEPTGVAIIQVSKSGDNSIIVYAGANGKIDREYIDHTLSGVQAGSMLVLQNEISCVAYAMEKAKEKGLKVALTPAPVTKELLAAPIELADWLLLNEKEGQAITGLDVTLPEELIKALSALYPNTGVVLTLGINGAICAKDGKMHFQPSFKANAVDTTASGDTFCGYFLAGILRGDDEQKAMEDAALAAAISVTRKGAAVSIPWRHELAGHLKDA